MPGPPTDRGDRLLRKCHEKPLIWCPGSRFSRAGWRPRCWPGRALTARLPFWFPTVAGETGVRVEVQLGLGRGQGSLRLRTCAEKPVRLARSDWPEGLAESVDRRYEARNGFDKGTGTFRVERREGRDREARCVLLLACAPGQLAAVRVRRGLGRSVDDAVGVALVERVLFGALRQLAADEHLSDRAVPRPADRLGWRVDHQDGAGDLQARRDWARAVATRAQRDFRFARLEKARRPRWAREGFYAERVF